MVCEKCEKKLSKVIVPEKWKKGSHNSTEGGGRKINENKLLSKKNREMNAGVQRDENSMMTRKVQRADSRSSTRKVGSEQGCAGETVAFSIGRKGQNVKESWYESQEAESLSKKAAAAPIRGGAFN